jgi:hypothetical protein
MKNVSLWGFDMLIVNENGGQVGVATTAIEGTTLEDAFARLKILHHTQMGGLPPGTRVGGMRPHQDTLAHLFANPNSPYHVPGWQPLVGPSVLIAEGLRSMQSNSGIVAVQ